MVEDRGNGVESGVTLTIPKELFAGRYRIVRRLANGGMGTVYLAEQTPLGRPVAIKIMLPVLPQERERSEEFRQRFLLEASTSANLSHPNIVTVYDYGETSEGALFLVMEYLQGRTLNSVLLADRRISPVRSCLILSQVCRALRVAHRARFMHRDLKPSNVMLLDTSEETDFVKVIDFGLAKNFSEGPQKRLELTQRGGWMGSPLFMAPEQFRNQEDGPQVDIYALGIVLYRCVFGIVPFRGDSQFEIMAGHTHHPISWPSEASSYPEICLIIDRCLQKQPAGRYGSVDELLDDLQSALGILSVRRERSNGSFDRGGPLHSGEQDMFSGSIGATDPQVVSTTKHIRPTMMGEHIVSSGVKMASTHLLKSLGGFSEPTSSVSFIEVPTHRVLLAWWIAVVLLGGLLGFLIMNLIRGWL
ncbi:MAG: serine/threonine protein kinase [Myxococcales bacterium]|nr:serine/threonine protein kinase [Myxococcales bacterium]